MDFSNYKVVLQRDGVQSLQRKQDSCLDGNQRLQYTTLACAYCAGGMGISMQRYRNGDVYGKQHDGIWAL